LLPALLENPSVPESELIKLAVSASRDTIDAMLHSDRVRSMRGVQETLRTNPYLKKEEAEELAGRLLAGRISVVPKTVPEAGSESSAAVAPVGGTIVIATTAPESPEAASPTDEEAVSAYLNDHAPEIAAEGNKPFQAIGGIVDTIGTDHAFATDTVSAPSPAAAAPAGAGANPAVVAQKKPPTPGAPQRQNTLQKINALDVKGRIQLALKGNKEERSILIRDGTKVVALAVLEAPKLADGEVEKFASQKNVLEAVLRQIPLKRRFMKNYVVVRNLVANPRTPLDLGLGLMKNLLAQDLKNLSANKEVSETIRKLALKMYKQKMEDSNKKK
jgi:hypothetical protein